MKTLSVALLTAMLASAAYADNRIDTEGFSIVNGWGDDHLWGSEVVSSVNGLVTISLPGLSLPKVATSLYWHEYRQNYFNFEVHDGYEITSLTFGGIYATTSTIHTGAGVSYPGPVLKESIGSATGYGEMQWSLMQPGSTVDLPSDAHIGGGIEEISQTHSQALTGSFSLNMLTDEEMVVRPTLITYLHPKWGYGHVETKNYGSIELSNVTLTLQVSPISAVPEPATYGMLLGGLGILGFAARRRKT